MLKDNDKRLVDDFFSSITYDELKNKLAEADIEVILNCVEKNEVSISISYRKVKQVSSLDGQNIFDHFYGVPA